MAKTPLNPKYYLYTKPSFELDKSSGNMSFLDEDENIDIHGCKIHIRLVGKIVLKTKVQES